MKQALSLIGVSFLSVVSSLAADKKPNIILILADDMRASGMNFLGKEQVQTPNLDKLAGESTVFTNATSWVVHPEPSVCQVGPC